MRSQDRLVAAIVGGIGALAIIIGTLLPAVSVGALSGPALIHNEDGIALAVLGLVIAWRVYRTYTEREHPFWIATPAIIAGVILAADWHENVKTVRVEGFLDLDLSRSAGTGLYVLALGVAMALGSAVALGKIRFEVWREDRRGRQSAKQAREAADRQKALMAQNYEG